MSSHLFKLFLIILTICVSFCFAKTSDKHRLDRKNVVQDLAGIISIDKDKSQYFDSLRGISGFPNINFKESHYLVEYDQYINSLMPYLISKVKNKDLDGQLPLFYKAIKLAKNMNKNLKLTHLEVATFDFLEQNLKTQNALFACNQLISKYSDQEKMIDLQLERLEHRDNKESVSILKKIKNELNSISKDINKLLKVNIFSSSL